MELLLLLHLLLHGLLRWRALIVGFSHFIVDDLQSKSTVSSQGHYYEAEDSTGSLNDQFSCVDIRKSEDLLHPLTILILNKLPSPQDTSDDDIADADEERDDKKEPVVQI